jgi:hypothetical protein
MGSETSQVLTIGSSAQLKLRPRHKLHESIHNSTKVAWLMSSQSGLLKDFSQFEPAFERSFQLGIGGF